MDFFPNTHRERGRGERHRGRERGRGERHRGRERRERARTEDGARDTERVGREREGETEASGITVVTETRGA